MSEASERARRLGEDSWELALLADAWLQEAMKGPERDVKRAKELTSMLKDLVTLGRELGGSAPAEPPAPTEGAGVPSGAGEQECVKTEIAMVAVFSLKDPSIPVPPLPIACCLIPNA